VTRAKKGLGLIERSRLRKTTGQGGISRPTTKPCPRQGTRGDSPENQRLFRRGEKKKGGGRALLFSQEAWENPGRGIRARGKGVERDENLGGKAAGWGDEGKPSGKNPFQGGPRPFRSNKKKGGSSRKSVGDVRLQKSCQGGP